MEFSEPSLMVMK